MKRKIWIMMLLFPVLCTTSNACSHRESAYLDVVEAYERAHNDYDVDGVMALFAEEAAFELVGQGILSGQPAIRAIHDYDVGIHSQLTFHNCRHDGNMVQCEVREHNDWLTAAGLEPIFYPSSVFTMTEEGRIQKIVATISEKDGVAMGAVLAEFTLWLLAERSGASQSLFTADGRFVYSKANGRLVVTLLREWRAEQGDG